ncbi:hypothetical protein CAPTEDRAFT_223113 [Capitella teleta]|uniref:SEA domain-containing protein n=1 Tax=Capitella teleta TaxID=283909 RepID=R7T531_CAPTE|nr:hypothetical protein CAPTEDRAFT_223113 [Capitella teleta]|eukprot:ELT88061.1 hypothetical protein CAPTEDRAFT_223113 [Capitella teleta]
MFIYGVALMFASAVVAQNLDGRIYATDFTLVLDDMRTQPTTTAALHTTSDPATTTTAALHTTSDPATTTTADLHTTSDPATTITATSESSGQNVFADNQGTTLDPTDVLHDEIQEWLENDIFDNVTGFKEVLVLASSERESKTTQDVKYTVNFDLKELVESGSFVNETSEFVEKLKSCKDEIAAQNKAFANGDFEVNGSETTKKMDEEIIDLVESFDNRDVMCKDRGDICPNKETTCDIEDGNFICTMKCEIFNELHDRCEEDPRWDLIYVKGNCTYDDDGNPFCDCGSSVGDILDNFYDGHECVSTAFIVGMATVGAGFIILVLLGVVIGLGVTNCNQSDKIQSLESDVEGKEARSPVGELPANDDDDDIDDVVGMNDIEMTKTPSESDKRSYNPNIYDNQAFDEGEERDEKPTNHSSENGVKPPSAPIEEPSYGYNMYEELAPRLSHIDPAVDYSIKRPTVTLRPTDAYTNDRGYPEDIQDSARL